MDEQWRQAIRAERDAALAERGRLDVVISYLSERLGEPTPPGGPGGLSPNVSTMSGHDGGDPVEGTHEGEYLGETSTDAAYKVLAKFGSKHRLLKTKELFDAIRKGGVQITSEEGFYKSLARSHRFKKVGRGTWGLMEWYPNLSPPKKLTREVSNVADLRTPEVEVADTALGQPDHNGSAPQPSEPSGPPNQVDVA